MCGMSLINWFYLEDLSKTFLGKWRGKPLKMKRGRTYLIFYLYIFIKYICESISAVLKPCKSYGAIALLSPELAGAGPGPSAEPPAQLVLCNDYSSSQIKPLPWETRAPSWVETKQCSWSTHSCWISCLPLLEILKQPEHHLTLRRFCGCWTWQQLLSPVKSPGCGWIIFPNSFIPWLTQEHIPAALRREPGPPPSRAFLGSCPALNMENSNSQSCVWSSRLWSFNFQNKHEQNGWFYSGFCWKESIGKAGTWLSCSLPKITETLTSGF